MPVPPSAVRLQRAPASNSHKRRRPRWNRKTGELSLDGILVKRIEQPAANLRTILDAFEEDGWPPVVDDPLPPRPGLDSHQRLRDAIRRLNLCQINRLLWFHSTNRGTAIRWEVRA